MIRDINLPRGNPVKENMNPGKINLPEAIDKLKVGLFTGYLHFNSEASTGIMIFEKGQMISAFFESGAEPLIAFDAIACIFEQSLIGGYILNIYRLSAELAMSIHALLHGDILYQGQELKLLNIKTFLGKIREDCLNGCLRIYTEDNTALIFYENGSALGFFHDGSKEIETTAEAAMSLAKMPGAKVDLLSTKNLDELMRVDLVTAGDLKVIWEKTKEILQKRAKTTAKKAAAVKKVDDSTKLEKAQNLLRETASKFVGRIGVALVEKEFNTLSRKNEPLNSAHFEHILDQLSKGSKMVAGPSKVNDMIACMREEVIGLLK